VASSILSADFALTVKAKPCGNLRCAKRAVSIRNRRRGTRELRDEEMLLINSAQEVPLARGREELERPRSRILSDDLRPGRDRRRLRDLRLVAAARFLDEQHQLAFAAIERHDLDAVVSTRIDAKVLSLPRASDVHLHDRRAAANHGLVEHCERQPRETKSRWEMCAKIHRGSDGPPDLCLT
jgi:hypothetical protein